MKPLDNMIIPAGRLMLEGLARLAAEFTLPCYNPALFKRLERCVGLFGLALKELEAVNQILDGQAEITPAPVGVDSVVMHAAWLAFLEEQTRQVKQALYLAKLTPEQQAAILAEGQRQAIDDVLRRQRTRGLN